MAKFLSTTVVVLACLVFQQNYVFGTLVCTSPFQGASNDPTACFLAVPSTAEDAELFCESFEEDPNILRRTPVYYDVDMDICYYYLVPIGNPGPPPEGCCGGGLPGR